MAITHDALEYLPSPYLLLLTSGGQNRRSIQTYSLEHLPLNNHYRHLVACSIHPAGMLSCSLEYF